MVRIVLLSDTHGFLDEALFPHFEACDEIWHAGDLGSSDILERLAAVRPVRAVHGNIDGADVRASIPSELDWDCEGLHVYMTHIGGSPGRYAPGMRVELQRRRPDLFVCGHSHIFRVERDPKLDLIYLNPGACGRHGWHQVRTALRLAVDKGKVVEAEAVNLGPRAGR